MSPTRSLARPLLAAIFLGSGASQLKDHSYITQSARDAGLSEPELLAKAHVYGNLGAGLALATGRFPRTSAALLAANLIPTTLVGHAFWSAPAEQKQMQQVNFMKNLSILGGLLLAVADTGGRESLPHAVGRVGRSTAKKADKAREDAGKKAEQTRADTAKKADRARTNAAKKTDRARANAAKKTDRARATAAKKAGQARGNAKRVRQAA